MSMRGDWQGLLDFAKVEFVPLVDGDADGDPGWCIYPWGFDAPEVEVLVLGQNTKAPDAAAIWRQGFLVHFGLEETPARLNDTGDALLVNTIAYAARCGADRPLVRLAYQFRMQKRDAMPRENAFKFLSRVDSLETWFPKALAAELTPLSLKRREVRFREWEPFLVSGADGRLEVDEDLRRWGIANRDPQCLDRCEHALRKGGGEAAQAQRVLARYVPEGPGGADADAWAKWIEAHRPYVFFSDVGGYRWYVDPLAKARGVPTGELRGARRVAKPGR
ncbi:MAG TPA: hypothetical protein VF384_15525 [Planctomycetota bacterium]